MQVPAVAKPEAVFEGKKEGMRAEKGNEAKGDVAFG